MIHSGCPGVVCKMNTCMHIASAVFGCTHLFIMRWDRLISPPASCCHAETNGCGSDPLSERGRADSGGEEWRSSES